MITILVFLTMQNKTEQTVNNLYDNNLQLLYKTNRIKQQYIYINNYKL